ncbi:MAG TPA: PilZ domain-containing protein [Terriglobales bacterium]|nr:PilZ domain-containing protein [Terriglobales bacterium]
MIQGAAKSAIERRRFERVGVGPAARVRVTDPKGQLLGTLRQIGRGGIALEPEKPFKKNKKLKIVISDQSEKIRFQVNVVVRHAGARHVGLEFRDLDAEAAVDVGILIGKYYEERT